MNIFRFSTGFLFGMIFIFLILSGAFLIPSFFYNITYNSFDFNGSKFKAEYVTKREYGKDLYKNILFESKPSKEKNSDIYWQRMDISDIPNINKSEIVSEKIIFDKHKINEKYYMYNICLIYNDLRPISYNQPSSTITYGCSFKKYYFKDGSKEYFNRVQEYRMAMENCTREDFDKISDEFEKLDIPNYEGKLDNYSGFIMNKLLFFAKD